MRHFYWDLGLAVAAVFLVSEPAQAQPSIPSEYVIKLSPADLDLIGKALGAQPFNDVAPLFQKLRQQVSEQQKPPEPEKK